MTDYGDESGGPSDQAIRDIVAQLNAPAAAPSAPAMGSLMTPAPEVTPTMTYAAPVAAQPASRPAPILAAPAQAGVPLDITPTLPAAAAPSTIPGPGGYSPADRFNKFSLPAGGGPLSVDDANKVIASYESTGGHAFAPANPSARTIQVGNYAMPIIGSPTRAAKEDDWMAPVPTMTPPPVTFLPMGATAAVRRQ